MLSSRNLSYSRVFVKYILHCSTARPAWTCFHLTDHRVVSESIILAGVVL